MRGYLILACILIMLCMHCLFDEQFRIEIDAKQNADLMDDDNEDLFNDEARDEYDLDEDDNDDDI